MSFNAILTADVKGLVTGVDKAEQAIDKFAKTASEKIANLGKSFEDVGKKASIMSAAIVAAGAAIFALTKKTGDFASTLLSASVALDATTDMLQQYKLVAIEAGTSANAFDRSTEALVRRLKDVNTEGDNTGDIIRRLGVSLTDSSGGMRKVGDVSDDVIKSLADMNNASERNILASQLFGRSWVELAPILDMGSEAIENIKGSANDLGIVLGEDSLNAANDFNVAVEKMKLQAEAMAMQLGARLAPVLQDNILPLIEDHIIPAIINFADRIASLAEWFGNLEPSTKKLIGTIGGVALAIGPVLLILGKVIAIAPAVGAAVTAMTGPIGVIVMAVAAAVTAIIYYWDEIKAYFTEGAGASTFTSISEAATKVKDVLIRVFTIIKDVVTKIWDKFGGYITGAFSAVFDTIMAVVDWFIEQVGNAADFFGSIVDGDFSGALDALGNMFTSTFNAILRIVTNRIGQAANIVAGLFDAIGMDKWAAKTKGFADNMIAAYQPIVEETGKATKQTEAQAVAQDKVTAAVNRTSAAIVEVKDEIGAINDEWDLLLKNVDKNAPKLEFNEVELEKPFGRMGEILADYQEKLRQAEVSNDVFGDSFDKLDADINATTQALQTMISEGFVVGDIGVDALMWQLERLREGLEETAAVVVDYGSIIAGGITDFAASIGEAFADGNFDNLGSALLGAMGSMLSQFGAMLISAAVGAEALQALITQPWLALAAGIALVALGAAATKSAQKIVGGTTGVGGGSMGGTNSYNKTSGLGDSLYRGAYQDNWGSEVVFKIGNNELVGVLENASNRRNRL